jgi:DNA-directed RNA polymerase alpha subunit
MVDNWEYVDKYNLDRSIKTLGLSSRTTHRLIWAGVTTLRELLTLSKEELFAIPHVGPKTIEEIRTQLDISWERAEDAQNTLIEMDNKATLFPGDVWIEDVGLSIRTVNALKRAGIDSVFALANLSMEQIQRIRNVGEKAIREIQNLLDDFALESLDVSLQGERVGRVEEALPVSALKGVTLESVGLCEPTAKSLERAGIWDLADLVRLGSDNLVALANYNKIKHFERIEAERILSALLERSSIALLEQGVPWDCAMDIGERLKAYGDDGLQEILEDSVFGQDIVRFLSKIGCPLNLISASRLAANVEDHLILTRSGLKTVMQVCLSSEEDLKELLGDGANQFIDSLEWYLQALPALDWDAEIADLKPNPVLVHRLRGLNFANYLDDVLAGLDVDERDRAILVARLSQSPNKSPTLQELADAYGVTRERIRQIAVRAKSVLKDAVRRDSILKTVIFLSDHMINKAGLLAREEFANDFSEVYGLEKSRLCSTLMTLIQFSTEMKYDKRTDVLVSISVDIALVKRVARELLSILRKAKAPVRLGDLEDELLERLSKKEAALCRERKVCEKVLQTHPKFEHSEGEYWGLAKWRNSILDELVMALREKGAPAHFREITQLTNKRLGQDNQISDRRTHAALGRRTDLFVRTGPGTFALREWNPDLPDQPESYRVLIAQVLEEHRRPMSVDEVFHFVDEMRAAKLSTITMLLQMHEDFDEIEGGRFGLTKWNGYKSVATGIDLPEDFKRRLQERARIAWEQRKQDGAK